jgi:hypothetical protein
MILSYMRQPGKSGWALSTKMITGVVSLLLLVGLWYMHPIHVTAHPRDALIMIRLLEDTLSSRSNSNQIGNN